MTVTSPCAGKDRQSDRQTHISHLVQREDEQSYKKTDTPPCAGGDNQTDTRIPPCEEGKWTIIQKDRHPHPMQMETDNRTDKHTHTSHLVQKEDGQSYRKTDTPTLRRGRQTLGQTNTCTHPILCRGKMDNHTERQIPHLVQGGDRQLDRQTDIHPPHLVQMEDGQSDTSAVGDNQTDRHASHLVQREDGQ